MRSTLLIKSNNDGASRSNIVYNAIWDNIINNNLKEGDKLCVKELSDRFGFSITPVREALIMLEQEGVVKTVGREGTFIRKMTKNEIREIYIVREALETMAAQLGAKGISDDALALLENVQNRMNACLLDYDAVEFVKLDIEFHRLIVGSCNVKLLSDMCYNLGLLSASIHYKGKNHDIRIKEYASQHGEIYNAFVQHDEVLAVKLIRQHIQEGKMDVLLDFE